MTDTKHQFYCILQYMESHPYRDESQGGIPVYYSALHFLVSPSYCYHVHVLLSGHMFISRGTTCRLLMYRIHLQSIEVCALSTKTNNNITCYNDVNVCLNAEK